MKCACGRKEEAMPCMKYQKLLRERAGKRHSLALDALPTLDCDAACAGEARLRGLAEAVGVRRDHQWQPDSVWAPELLETAKRRQADVRALERVLHEFLEGPKVLMRVLCDLWLECPICALRCRMEQRNKHWLHWRREYTSAFLH